MNETTNEAERSEFSPEFYRWIITSAISVLLFVFLVRQARGMSYAEIPGWWMPAATVAAGIQVNAGINEFQGFITRSISIKQFLSSYISLCTALIIAPTFLLLCWRTLKRSDAGLISPSPIISYLNIIGFSIGVCFTLITIFGTVKSAIAVPRIYASMKADDRITQHRDQLIDDLTTVYMKAIPYYYSHVPGNRHRGFQKLTTNGKPTEIIAISDLGLKKDTGHGTLMIGPGTTDTVLVVHAIGILPVSAKAARYENLDGSSGFPEYSIEIHPTTNSYSIARIQ
jgi:hypothetical protein